MSLIYGGDKLIELENLYKTYFYDIYLYMLSLSKDKYIAEDITSETFIRAIKSIDSFKGNCDIRVWLCQIAKNCYFSYLKKNKKLSYLDNDFEQMDELNVEQMIISKESITVIHQIINNLKDQYKEVFSLRFFNQLSFKEIGNLFGKSENWACVIYHRARKKIQKELEDYYEDYM